MTLSTSIKLADYLQENMMESEGTVKVCCILALS